jgi:hypothetical protein
MQILLPVGRLIGGSVHKLQEQKDQKTKQVKIGADGKPVANINFRVAIPKTMADWRHESFVHPTLGVIKWGEMMHGVAFGAQPLCNQIKDFAFKIKDGDSTDLDSKLKPFNQGVGRAGNWIISFTQNWAPKLVTADGVNELPGERFVVGYFVQVLADVKYNNSTESPGLYVNPVAVALAGEGEAISVDVDTTSVGFGGTALPAGATAVAPASTGFGAQPAPYVAGAAAAPAPAAAAPALLQVAPNAAFMAAPAPAAPAPVHVPKRVMTAKAGNFTYEQYMRTPGWTEQMLIDQGFMVIQ